jgi:outer membrane protein TolC
MQKSAFLILFSAVFSTVFSLQSADSTADDQGIQRPFTTSGQSVKSSYGQTSSLAANLQSVQRSSLETNGAIEGTAPRLSLDSAIQIGLNNYPELRASAEKINAARGRFWSAISPPPADLSILHDYIPGGQPLGGFGEKTIGISQSIEFPTNYFLRGAKSSIEKNIAENELALAKLLAVTNVKKAYFNALALQAQVKIARENLSIAQDFVKKAEVRHSVGEGANLERLTAKVNYTEAENRVEITKSHLIAAFAELNYAMGNGKGTSRLYNLSDTLSFTPCDFTLSQLSNDAALQHPQLKAGKLQIDSYAKEKSLAWSSVLPNFTCGYFSKQVRGDATRYYGLSLTIGIPLWFLLDQRGKIHEASANVTAARCDLHAAENTVFEKTHAAFAEFKHQERQVLLYIKDVLPQAEEIFRTASKSYEAGESTYLEFLQAQQTLINSRGNYIEALLSYNLSIVAIEEAIGKTF